MAKSSAIGSQKQARLERLKREIVAYVAQYPGCSAADIVCHLANNRKMRNHGLTARKIGFFIPRYLNGFRLLPLLLRYRGLEPPRP